MSDRLREAADELAAYRAKRGGDRDPDLFTILETVAEHAGTIYKQEALQAVYETARRKPSFTVMDLDGLLPPAIDKRAVGWVLREGQRRGWYRAHGYETGDRTRHGRPVVIWSSLIYRGEAS